MQNIDIHTIADIAGRIERWLVCRNLEKMPEVFHDILGKTDRDNSVDRIQKKLRKSDNRHSTLQRKERRVSRTYSAERFQYLCTTIRPLPSRQAVATSKIEGVDRGTG